MNESIGPAKVRVLEKEAGPKERTGPLRDPSRKDL